MVKETKMYSSLYFLFSSSSRKFSEKLVDLFRYTQNFLIKKASLNF